MFNAEKFLAFRRSRQLSLRAVGAICDLSYSAISLYENGLRQPSLRSLRKLERALAVEKGFFLI